MLSNFPFIENDEKRDGYFTMIVSADNPEEAVEKFEKKLKGCVRKMMIFFQISTKSILMILSSLGMHLQSRP